MTTANRKRRQLPESDEETTDRRLGDGRASARPHGDHVETNDDTAALRRVLGARIREARLAADLTIKSLARIVGVTPGMISQLERGAVLPSIPTLLQLSTSLGMTPGEFFDVIPPSGVVVRCNDRSAYNYPNLGVRDELISADPSGRIQVFVSHLEPGATSGEELVQQGNSMNLVLVVRGQLKLYLEDRSVLLLAGDAVTFSSGTPHGFANPTKETTEVTWVIGPAEYHTAVRPTAQRLEELTSDPMS